MPEVLAPGETHGGPTSLVFGAPGADPGAPQGAEPIELSSALDADGLVDAARFAELEQSLATGERWSDLARLYALGAERAPDGAEGRRFLLSGGLLWLEKLGEPRRAEPLFRRALATDPADAEALDSLRSICLSAGRFEEAADLLDLAIEYSADEDKPDLFVELASIAYGDLQQVDRALLALRFAYEYDPSRKDVLERARAIFAAEARFADAKRVLDDEARSVLGDGPDVPSEVPADDVRGIADAYRNLGVRLLDHPIHHALAEECLERARALGDREALSKLDELAHIKNDWEARAAACRDAGFEAREKRRAAQLYLQAAELYHRYGKDPLRAEEYLDRCLLLGPGFPPALHFIESTYREAGRSADLVKRLSAMVATVKDPQVKADILLRAARHLETEVAAAPESAKADLVNEMIGVYRRALALLPGHRDAATRLTTILGAEGRHSDRAQVLESHLASVTDDYAKVEAHLELGRIYAELLGDSSRARAHFEAVLSHSPKHFAAASALRALYKDAREPALLLGVLEILVGYSPDLFSRLELLSEMAEVAAEVGREEELSVRRQVFELDPNATGVRERLEALAEELSRHQALADAYSAAAAARSGERAVDLWLAAGRLYDTKVARPRDAIEAFRRALALDPTCAEAREALERLLRQQDDPAALLEILKSQLAGSPKRGEEVTLLLKIGDVQDRELGRLDDAVATFQRVLTLDPNNTTALANLDDLHRRREQWDELVQILVRREAFADGTSDLAEMLARRARVLHLRLARNDEAAELYLDVLARFPDHSEAVTALRQLLDQGVARVRIARALEPILAQRGQHAAQVEMLAVQAAEETDAKKKRELARRAAQIAEGRLSDLPSAFGHLTTALEADPGSEELLDAFLRIARELREEPRAATLLKALLDREGLAPEAASQCGSALAELYELSLGDRAAAIEGYRRALAADGSNAGAIAALERLLGAEGRYDELASLLEERIARADAKEAKVQLGLALASLRRDRLSDLDGAIDAYREVLSAEPAESGALAQLAEALERQERWRELVGVLDRMGEAADDPQLIAMTEVKAGEVLRTHLGDRKEALARYGRALQLSPGNESAVRGLEPLLEDVEMRPAAGALLEPHYTAAERWRDLVIALESQLSTVAEPERRRALLVRIAEVEAQQLGQPDGAYETMVRAFREGLVPPHERAALEQLALRANRAKALSLLYEDTLETGGGDEALERSLARLYDGAAADSAKAKGAWTRLLDRAPGDAEALEALERLTGSGDDPVALAKVLLARAEAAPSTEERVAFFKRAAAIYEEAVEDTDGAIDAMERARDADPNDRTTWQELERYYESAGERGKLERALGAEAALLEEPLQKANVLVRRAEVLVSLGAAERAIEEYRAALGTVPEHAPARAGLEALLATAAGPKAALALEPVYRAAGDWAHLVEAYEILAEASTDPEERVERLVAIRSIWEERLGKLDRAFSAASRAYKEAPHNEALLASLERLGRLSGSVEELLALLEDQAEALPYVSEDRPRVRLRIAGYTETLLRDRGRAIEAYRRVLEERPDSLQALEALERIYAKGGEARELVEVLRTMAGLLQDPERQTSRLRLAGRILEEKLGDRAQAARAYEQVLMLAPGDRDALTRLDRIYGELRSSEDLARVLDNALAVASDEEKGRLLLRLGQLRESALEDPRGALAAFTEVLRYPPQEDGAYDGALFALEGLIGAYGRAQPELAAAAALAGEPHWADKAQWAQVVTAKEARIVASPDPSTRKALLTEIAELYEQRLEQPEMAFLSLTRAYGEWPNDGELATALERLAVAADTEEELAELYAQALPSLEDDELAMRLARRAAHIYDHVVGRGEAAVPFYNRVLHIAPDDPSALTALERIHRRAGQAGPLVEVLRGMLRLAEGDAVQQKALWSQIAQISEDEQHDEDAAFEAYREMLALDPEDGTVLSRMAALCERSGRVEDLAAVLAKRASLAKDPNEQAQVLLRLASLQKDRLDDPRGAVEAYAEALAARPGDPGAIAGLAAMLRGGGEAKADAAAALAPVYFESGAFEEYIACLEAQIPASRESERKKELLVRIATVYEQRLGRPEHAFNALSRALHEDLGDDEVRARADRLATENDLLEDLAAFYLDEVDAVSDHRLAMELRRRVAEIYDRHLDDVPRAIAEYNRILDVAPGDQASLEALERLYRRSSSFGALAEVYRRRIAQTEGNEARARLLREFARLLAEDLGDAPGAIAALRRLLEIETRDVDALKRLAELCGAQGRASELADVLERLIEAADEGSPVQLDAKVRLAKLKTERLGDLGGAEALLGSVLEHDPKHEAARDALQERFEDAVAEEDLALAQSTGELLSSAMRRAEEWPELISVLRVRAGLAASGLDRVPLNREIAEIYRDRLEQPDMAFSTLAQVYADAPGLDDVRAELEALAEELLRHESLVDVLEAGLDSVHDGELELQVRRRMAQLLERKVGDRERAAEAWQAVLEAKPKDPEALESLDGLNLALGRWAALADVLEKRVEGVGEDDDLKHDLYVRLGSIWDERLSERAEALSAYRKARGVKTRDKETLGALARLLDPAEDPQELFAVLEALAEQSKDSKARLRLYARMAELAGGPLERRAEGIELWKKVLEADEDHRAAQDGIEELYEKEARWRDLADLLEKQVVRARDEKEVVRLQRKLGLIKGTRLGSVDEAVRSWSEILKRNPNDVEALNSLRATYRGAARYEELIGTLRKLIPLQTNAQGVKSIRFELAEVFLTHLGQREEAIESAKRVLDVEPHTVPELMRLEEIFVATGAFGEAVKVMNERAEQAETTGERIEILFDIAKVYEEKILRRAGAAAAYEKVLGLERTSSKAYDALAQIYETNGDYRKLVELYNRRLEVTEIAQARRKLLFAIIDVQERWLGQPELAFTAACRAFGEEGADEAAQHVAERLAEETGNWEILVEVYEEQVEAVSVARGVELRRRLGQIYLEKLEDEARAEVHLEMVLSMRPEDEAARSLLLGLLQAAERWQDVIAQLVERVELTSELDEKKKLFWRIAEIQENRLEDVEGAISSLKRILDLDPDDQRTLLELVRIFRASAKWHPLLNALARRLELAENEDERIKIRFDVAQVWEQGVQDLDHAIEAYGDVLALDDGYLPALKALERLYSQEERWIELVDIYERQVSLVEQASDAITILARIAAIWEEQFRDLEGASKTLIRVLEIDPEHLPSVKSLERIWREAGDWEHLIEAIYRHVELATEKAEVVDLHLQAGEIYLRELGRVDQAETAFTRALDTDPTSREAIHALGQLHERHGNWFNALEMLHREAQLVGSLPEAVEIHYRMGTINEEMLMDRAAAKEAFQKTLDIEPSHAPALRALRNVAEEEGDFGAVIDLEAQEAEHSQDPTDRAELFVAAAEHALEHFEDDHRAMRLFEEALQASPTYVPALRTLSDLYFAEEEWEKSEKLLEKLVDKLDAASDQEELCRHYYRLAYIAEKIGEDHQALRRYLASYELDSTYLPTLEGLGAALLRAERWEDAQRIFQTILIQHRASLTDAEVVDLHFQIGELSERLDQLERAKKSFQKALDLDADHPPTLRAFAALSERLEEWEDAYDLRERLISQLDGDEKLRALVEQAKLCEEKIQEPYRAIDAYVEAKRIRPEDEHVLRRLVKLFEDTSQMPRTIEVLEDLARVVPEGDARRDVFMQLARVHWDKQKNAQAAVEVLNRALDLDAMHVEAFSRVEQILFETKSWVALEENYHRMIKRMPKEQKKARVVLWRSLGDLYTKVLKNEDGARVAYEVVLKLDAEASDVTIQLAALYGKKRDLAPKALALYHRVLPTADDPAMIARRLFELYHALGYIDRAFCALGALLLMRAASEDEQRAYQLLLKRTPAAASRSMSDSVWRAQVLHPQCRNSLADILSVLYRGAPDLFAEGQRNLAVKKKEAVDLDARGRNARVRLRYFDVWQRLNASMNVGEVRHYHRPGATDAPRMYPGAPAVLFAGESHEVFKTMPPRQLAWVIARQMAAARPELAVVRSLPPDEVGAAIEGAIQLYSPEGSGVDLSLDPRAVQAWSRNLGRSLSETALKALREPVVACIQRRDMKQLAKFLEGAEHSASRAALLMAGDVVAAERGLGESDQLVAVSFRARVRALMLFALSDEHFSLREKLGLAIPAAAEGARGTVS